jgi:hypothetical protein
MFATASPLNVAAARPRLASASLRRVAPAARSGTPFPRASPSPRRRGGSAATLAPRLLARRGDTTLVRGLKDFKNLPDDLKSVNAGEMGEALAGNDRQQRTDAVVGIGGCVSCAIMTWSLVTLKDTGCGLPPGPGGLLGAAEGVSYLYVVGLVAYSAWTKAKTGSGLPAGPGGVLGLAEGLAYLLVVAGVGVGVAQVADFGALPNAIPAENGKCFSP